MNVVKFCKSALDDIHSFSKAPKEQKFIDLVNERLEQSFNSYNHEVNLSLEYLQRRNELTVIRKMNRML